ncbi:MAG: DUF4340 domain-containing protein [Cyanobacteria bacterium P01_H01_bin.105]
MKLQRSTGILLGVALSMAATVAIVETQKGTSANNDETLYSFTEADVSALTIKREAETLSFIKTDSTWQMTEPEETPADPSSIAFLLNIITSDAIQETITTTPEELDTYGLDQPAATLQLVVDEETYALTIGDEDFSGTSLYVMTADDGVEASTPIDVYLVPKGLENGVERPVDDWIAKDTDEASEQNTNTNNTEALETEPSTEENADTNDTDASKTEPSTEATEP